MEQALDDAASTEVGVPIAAKTSAVERYELRTMLDHLSLWIMDV